MKVLIADKFPELYIKKIQDLGLEVINSPKLGENDLPSASKEVDIIIVRSTVVNSETIENSKKLSLIIRAGAGVNNINIKSANQKGIYVSNCPGKNSIAVAELTMGLICALDRKIADNVIDFRNGVWNKGIYSKAEGLYRKTLGIVGTGQIGAEVITRAHSFGMDIIAWSRSLNAEKATELGAVKCDSLEELFSKADIVSIHLAQTADTKKLINKNLFDKMKNGAMFINTSRAGVVDEDALFDVASNGKIYCGLDVFNEEPEGKDGSVSSKLSKLKNVYVTHHIGASTEQAQNAVAEETFNIISDYVKHGEIRNWVNRNKQTKASYQLIVKHFDKPGVLAKVLNILSEEKVNVKEMENVIFDGDLAACCTIKIESAPKEKSLERMNSLENEVISASLVKL